LKDLATDYILQIVLTLRRVLSQLNRGSGACSGMAEFNSNLKRAFNYSPIDHSW